jgi:hypothetical protein
MDDPEKLATWVRKTQDEDKENKPTTQYMLATTTCEQTRADCAFASLCDETRIYFLI